MNQQLTPVEPRIVMVSIDMGMFGGYKRTNEQDITDAGGVSPDTDVLTKGGKRIFPSDKLKAFGTAKKGILRDLSKLGVKALGGGSVIAINEQDLPEAENILEKGQFIVFDLLAELWNSYATWMDDYIASNPKGGEIIRRSALSREEAISRFSYDYDTFSPTPVGKNGSVESMASKLTSQLYVEVAQAAAEAYDKTFAPADSSGVRHIRIVGQRAKSPLKACRDKLEKLSFLNPNVLGAVEIIDRVLGATQATGFIEDEPSNPCAKRLLGLVELMKDADMFASAAAKFVASSTPEEDIEVFCGIASLWQPTEQVAQAIESIAAVAEQVVTVTADVTPKPVAPAKDEQAVNPELLFF